MSFAHGKGAGVLVAQFDLTSDLTAYSFSKARQLPNVTTFGNDDAVFLAGLGEGSIALQGVWNPAADRSDEEINGIDGTESVITASPQGLSAIGQRAHMVNGFVENYQPRSPANDAVRFSSGLKGSAGAYMGVVLHHNNQEASIGAFTAVDNSASTANGATAFLHVTQFAGTDATITIQDSASPPTYGTLVAFTQVTGLTSQKVTVAGTIEQHARINLTGTFTTITFVVSFKRHHL